MDLQTKISKQLGKNETYLREGQSTKLTRGLKKLDRLLYKKSKEDLKIYLRRKRHERNKR